MSTAAGSALDRPLIRLADLTGPDAIEVGATVRAYLQQTELEKSLQEHGAAPDPVPPLPERYLREVEDPAAAYAAHRVRVALLGARVVGVVVLSMPRRGGGGQAPVGGACGARSRGGFGAAGRHPRRCGRSRCRAGAAVGVGLA